MKFHPHPLAVSHGGNPETELSEARKHNLKKLADFLMALDLEESRVKFDMSKFAQFEDGQGIDLTDVVEMQNRRWRKPNKCGTSACAVGFGPMAGINRGSCDLWTEYCSYNFVHTHTKAFDFLFHSNHVNCPQAAARRIYYFLQHGIPLRVETDEERERCDPYTKVVPEIEPELEIKGE